MNEKIIVPTLGESISEATVSKWLKKIGDQIEVDEPLVELETDKVNIEVPSPASGILSEIKFANGKTVEVGAELGVLETGGKISKTKEIEPKTITEDDSNVINLDNKKDLKIFDEESQEKEEDP